MTPEDASASTGDSPVLRTTAGRPGLWWRGIDFYPTTDPEEYARRKARAFRAPPRTLCFVPSVGLGYGMPELLKGLPEGSAILCVEAFQEIMATAVACGLPQDPRLLIVRTDSPRGVATALQRLGPHRFQRVMEVALSAGYRLAPQTYRTLLSAVIDDLHRHWRNRLTLVALGSLQVRNLFANLPALAGAIEFGSLSTELPVVVTGAGPSLEASLPLLRALRDRYTLCAVDTALSSLSGSGLQPDVVIALEAQVANLQDFVGQGQAATTVLACDLSSHPAVPRLFPGRTAFFSSSFAPLRLFDRMDGAGLLPTSFPALGSVGVAAVHAALSVTDQAVFVTGLDFSYTGHRTHARGSPSHTAALCRAARRNPPGMETYAAIMARSPGPAEGKRGERVLTDPLLRSYCDTLARIVEESPGRIFDCGESGLPFGAKLLGTRELEEALAATPRGKSGVSARQGSAPQAETVRLFLEAEAARLAEAQALLRGEEQEAHAQAVLDDIDYAWVHFPEFPQGAQGSAPFRARIRRAVAYYGSRIARALSLL